MSKPTPINELFWSKVNVDKTVKCWHWRASKDKHGYGNFAIGRTIHKSHRVSFFLRNGKWPDTACHNCNNPSCCNPDHIYDGTPLSNGRDRVIFGRGRKLMGQAQWQATLSDEQATKVRQMYSSGGFSIEKLAAEFSSSRSAIQRIVSGKSYKHLLDI